MDTQAIKAALASAGMKLILYPKPEQFLELYGNCLLSPSPTEFVTDRSRFQFPVDTFKIDGSVMRGKQGWDKQLAGMRRNGFHGFVCGCKGKNGYGHDGEIHAWIGPNCPPETVIMFLAHEVGHYHGEPCADECAEEARADLFGLVAALAFRLFQQVQTDKSKQPMDAPPRLRAEAVSSGFSG